MTNLEWALKYAGIGWHVFPVSPHAKIPMKGSSGFHDATTDVPKIKGWWAENPDANIGVWAGKNVFCLDIDNKTDTNGKTKNGFLWLNAMPDLPSTVQQTTPSKSAQFIFKIPETHFISSSDQIAPGVDIRSFDGYFVVAPSFVKRTDKYLYEGRYEWLCDQGPFEMAPADAPEWLIDEILRVAPKGINCDHEKDGEYSNILTMRQVVDSYDKLRSMPERDGIIHSVHPIHGSTNGKNFRIDINKNVWACYRHKSKVTGRFVGGDPLRLIALMEGILDCEECCQGSLVGDKFKQVLKVVSDRFGISPDRISRKTIADIIPKMDEIASIAVQWEQLRAISNLCPEVARLTHLDQAAFFMELANRKIKLSREALSSLKKEIRKISFEKADKTWDLDSNGEKLPTDRNLLNIIKEDKELGESFKRNTFSSELDVVKNGAWCVTNSPVPRPITNDDDRMVEYYMLNQHGIEFDDKRVSDCITQWGILNHYNPVVEFIDSLEWDGVPRLEQWLYKCCNVEDNIYTRWVSKLILVSAIRRALHPGGQYDHVVCLAGNQGVKKTTLVETLGGSFYGSLSLADKDRDTVQKMRGLWIIELPEGISLAKKQIEEFKAFVTEKSNRERFAYERRVEKNDRKSIFIMTINPSSIGYLHDPTGLRRFLPIRINGEIDLASIIKARTQLFAEAAELEKTGFRIYLDKGNEQDRKIIEILDEELQIAKVADDYAPIIDRWIAGGQFWNGKSFVNIPNQLLLIDIWEGAFGGDKKTYSARRDGVKIADALKELGVSKGRLINTKDTCGWYYDISHLLTKHATNIALSEAKSFIE